MRVAFNRRMTSTAPDTPLIPSSLFETTSFNSRDQFDAWRERISVVFDVYPLETLAGGFLAMAHGFHLGDLVLTRTRFEAQGFVRTKQRARTDMLDHYLVQLYTEGGYVGEVDGNPIDIQAGTVSILDLARTTEMRASAAECISLVVPRDEIEPLLPRRINLHGKILDSGNGRLFSSYLLTLLRQLPTTELSQVPYISRATLSLLAACLVPSAKALDPLHESAHFDRRDTCRGADAAQGGRSTIERAVLEGRYFDDWVRMLRA